MTKIKRLFEKETMQTQCSVLGHRIDLYFHDSKLAIEIVDNGHSKRNIHYEIKTKRQQNKNSVVGVLKLILNKKTLMFLKLSMKQSDITEVVESVVF